MGGIGLQQFFICCFVGLAVRFQRQMKRDAPTTDQQRALRMLYTLYAVLTLITVSTTLPPTTSNRQKIHTAPDPHHLPPGRVLQRLQHRHPSPRSIPVHPRLHSHARRPRALQRRPSRTDHAGQRERFPQPQGEKAHWEEERQRENGGCFAFVSSQHRRCPSRGAGAGGRKESHVPRDRRDDGYVRACEGVLRNEAVWLIGIGGGAGSETVSLRRAAAGRRWGSVYPPRKKGCPYLLCRR